MKCSREEGDPKKKKMNRQVAAGVGKFEIQCQEPSCEKPHYALNTLKEHYTMFHTA
jgi:hypothetical protein